jgi:hypothetical protein
MDLHISFAEENWHSTASSPPPSFEEVLNCLEGRLVLFHVKSFKTSVWLHELGAADYVSVCSCYNVGTIPVQVRCRKKDQICSYMWPSPYSTLHFKILYSFQRFIPYDYSLFTVLLRIDPPHPLVCRKRRLNGAVLRMRPEKPRPHVTVGVAR